MIKIIYFVHGTTYDNELGICSGWNNSKLSDLGEKQAYILGKVCKERGNQFDVIFTSDLERAIETAAIAFPNVKKISDKRLRECNYGEYDGKSKKLVNYNAHIEIPFPNGESLVDVEKRIREFINFVKEKYHDKKIAIISHRAPQLAFEAITKGITFEKAIENDWRNNSNFRHGWEYIIQD